MTIPVRILGVDPGTRNVGYGVLEVTTSGTAPRRSATPFRYLECGVIEASPREDLTERIFIVAQALAEVIDEFVPAVMAIEKAFYGRNAASALKLGQARGALMLMARLRALPVFEYAPSQIKQAVTGHGRATKAEIQHRVGTLCQLQRPPATDAADALAIALCHGLQCNWRPSTLAFGQAT